MRTTQTRRLACTVRGAAAGFTLIEVLISIIILALGLLGIGVVFPVVIRQQRISTDEVAGVVQAQNAAGEILARLQDGTGVWSVWGAWRQHLWGGPPTARPDDDYREGKWALPAYEDDGVVELTPADNQGLVSNPLTLDVEFRTAPGGAYVWDLAVQPVYDGDDDVTNDRMRIAVFVRRVHARTRDGGLPVAVDRDGLPTVDRRENQGATYAAPITMQIEIVQDEDDNNVIDRRRVELVAQNDEEWAIFSQPGQKFVDALGNVFTVQRVEDEEERRVRIDPPIPATIRDDMAGLQLSIVTTPQPPVAVHIVEVTP